MADWAVILIIAACGYVPGRLTVAIFCGSSRRFDGDRLALAFSSLVLGLAISGWLALVLAELGLFSAGVLFATWLILTLVLIGLLFWRRRESGLIQAQILEPQVNPGIPLLKFLPKWSEHLFLAMWFIAALWLFFRPHQYIIGGADAGVYVNLAATISRSGSIIIEAQTLAELNPALYPALLRPLPERDRGTEVAPYYIFPGFYVTDAGSGEITPQFYPLHPVWQAVAYELGGVQPTLLMTGLWALLGGLAIYLTIRLIAGWEAAAIGLTGLSLVALQVWFARYPTTESLTQFLLWASLWSTLLWLSGRRPRALWALLAGLTLGEVLLVRIDTYFLLIVPLFAWFYLRWGGRWRRDDWWFFIPTGLLAVHSLVHAQVQSTPYFYNTFSYGLNLLRVNWLIPLLAIFIGGAVLIMFGRFRRYTSDLGRYRRPIVLAASGTLIILVIYGWFIRPAIGDLGASRDYWYAGGQIPTQLDRENLVRLAWYLSPIGIVLAVSGMCLLIWKADLRTTLLLIVGLLFSVLYLWRIQANPHQIYTMRRYIPVVLPFSVVATSYLFDWLMRQKRKYLAVSGLLLSVIWLVSLAWNARGFVSQVDYQGVLAQMDQFDSQLEPNSILLFNDQNPITLGDLVGTPLRYIYGHDVFSIRDTDALDEQSFREMISTWKGEGRMVYMVGDPGSLDKSGLRFDELFTSTFSSLQLEASYERKPTSILNIVWQLRVAEIKLDDS